jgi:hypothetical protein
MPRKTITQDQAQGLCILCNTNVQMSAAKSKLGYVRYISTCSSCTKKKYNLAISGTRAYSIHKKDTCEKCGFVAVHPCQLDVHHKDHKHNNNAVDNLMTLCANCHRLEHSGV